MIEIHGGGVTRGLDLLEELRLPIEAITLGHVILARSASSLARYREHERIHVRQWERWGPLFAVAYPVASLVAWLRGTDAYRGNRFEREAFEAESCGGREAHEYRF